MRKYLLLLFVSLTLSAHAQIPTGGYQYLQNQIRRDGWITNRIDSLKGIVGTGAGSFSALTGKPTNYPTSIPFVQDLHAALDARALSANVYTKTQSDLLYLSSTTPFTISTITGLQAALNDKAAITDVYSKTAADGRYKPIGYAPTISQVTGLTDSLYSKLNRSEFQASISNLASTTSTYSQSQVNTLLAGKAAVANTLTGYGIINAYTKTENDAQLATKANSSTSLSGYGIADAYTKTEADNKLLYASAKDLAAAGGFTLSTVSTYDNRTALQYAFDHPGPSNGVRVPVGIYYVSGPLDVYGTRQIVFDFGAQIRVLSDFASDPVAGNDGRYVLRIRAASVTVTGANIDCMGKVAAPIALYFADDVTIQQCNLKNWRIGGLGQHGIAVLASLRARILNNTLTNGEHAINVFKSDGTIVQGNFVDVMVHGGIYNVFTSNFIATANTVKNCGDVGLDSEGGANNLWTANFVTRCKNGELAIFSGANNDSYVSHHLIFSGNTIIREGTYVTSNATGTTSGTATCDAGYGACSIFGLDEGCYDSGFENNIISTSFGPAFWHNQLSDKSGRRIFFRGNHIVTSSGIFSTLDSDGLSITGNTVRCLSGSEAYENILRDMHNGTFARNVIRYEVAKTTNYAIRFFTASGWATVAPMVDHNTIYNAGVFAMQYDPYNNGSLVPTFWANDLGTDYTSNGGFDVTANASSGVKYVDQKFKILLPSSSGGTSTQLTTIPAIARMRPGKGTGDLGYGRVDYNGYYGQVVMIRGAGGGLNARSISLITAPNLTVSDGGGNGTDTWTLTNTTGTATSGYLDVTMNSY